MAIQARRESVEETSGGEARPFTRSGPFVSVADGGGPTIASYVEAFTETPGWIEWSAWPPDVFAVTNLVLDHTEAYRFVVAPPDGSTWPPTPRWDADVAEVARAWRGSVEDPARSAPDFVARLWADLVRRRFTPLADVRRGVDPRVWGGLLTLHAVADEACRELASSRVSGAEGFERSAWDLLDRHGSLSTIDPARVRIIPKTHFPSRGITIRSLSRYLALTYESVELRWHRVDAGSHWTIPDKRSLNVVLLPWPLSVSSDAFRPVTGPLENMDTTMFGFFEFEPGSQFDPAVLEAVLRDAVRQAGSVDAVVFPEAALSTSDVAAVERVLSKMGVGFLVAGVRESSIGDRLGRNLARVAICTGDGWARFDQPKHHRWCLDPPQIRQYHLSNRLHPAKRWWEAIGLPARTVEVIDLGGGATFAPLICEDLARPDEVADLLRRIGPSLVIALLLDGPQLADRWAGRYAAVLADDPGSAVLTLTSLGMAWRSHPPGTRRSRVVAMWADATSGRREIALARGAVGILLRADIDSSTSWTADGRRHEEATPAVVLSSVRQLADPGTKPRTKE